MSPQNALNPLGPAPARPILQSVARARSLLAARGARAGLLALAGLYLALAACGPHAASLNGYKPQAVPGITRGRCIEILGKPQDAQTFSLPNTAVQALVLTYPFGQVLVQNEEVVAIAIDDAPAFVGPFGVTLGMAQDDLRAALSRGTRSGHLESYDAIGKSSDTRTKDLYDGTDHMMIELTAANANDPLAPFNVAQITLANHAGLVLLGAFTKARLSGLYPDVHVDNFVSVPWEAGHGL